MSVATDKVQFVSRDEIPERYRWNLTSIFPGWDQWKAAYDDLAARVEAFARLQGTLAKGPDAVLTAFRATDEMGQLAYKVWYFAALRHDEDQRDNVLDARRQEVQILMAKWQQATSWFKPELLKIPLERTREWMAADPDLELYRFAIEDLYRQQEHVLDERGEHLLSLASRFESTPYDSYAALSTADVRFPAITLSDGEAVTLTYGQYHAVLARKRHQPDRAEAFRRFHEVFGASLNTYASLYNSVLQRDWFLAQARGYKTTLEAALHANNIPVPVVETLIDRTKAGVEPLRRYERVRKRLLGLDTYHVYDGVIPLVELDEKYPYDEVLEWIVESAAPLGPDYQGRVRRAVTSRWIDVYENAGKRSGAYSAPVYGVHPYMLLNYNNTLDAVFTLAHELGHSMHTMLSHEHQPFVYSDYTIFVAEVPSTLSEALFLDHMLSRTDNPLERIVLLQHAIDGIVGTFYTQVMFAHFELQAHRLVEQGRPVTADVLNEIYWSLLHEYHGDSIEYDDLARITWARIPHFFNSPYYVYQYATCFASTAQLVKQMTEGGRADRIAATERYLALLQAGGSDYPMELLKRAGVDLGRPEPVDAVVGQLDVLVARLEREIGAVASQTRSPSS
ncbi:MAG: oligoendopeptidase F [Acidobacteria bacterium]|nr:oligoendopeptidase F [Acidobacteriota bacterium]